jgi:signal transduction histidine kinase
VKRGRATRARGQAAAWWLGLVLWLGLSAAPAAAGEEDRIAVIEAARFCRCDDATLPPPTAAWTTVPLAHLWRVPAGRHAATAWFELELPRERVAQETQALYVPALNRSARVFVNGQLVAVLGSFEDPMPLNWNRAQLVVVPPALLHAGMNRVQVQERAYWFEAGWLSMVRAGPERLLRPVYEQRKFWQNDLVMMLGATTLVLSLLVLGVWMSRRDRTLYFWFGCATLVWSFISLDYFAYRAPIAEFGWEQALEVAQVLHAVLLYTFVLRFTGRRRPVLECGLWLYWAAGSLLVLRHRVGAQGVEAWYFGALVASLYFWGLLVRAAARHRKSEAALLAAGALTTIGLTAYDLWLFSRHSWTDRVYLAHFGAPVLMFAMGWVLMRNFVESLDAHERLAAELERRVQDKARELEANYEQLAEARRTEALAVERARIMSEMHDGIGSQLTMALSLVGAAAGAGGDPVATVLRQSIEDLQLIIDSLEPVEDDLLTVLGALRYRVEDRLRTSGIEIRWNVRDLPPMPWLTPQNVLSVLRIFQEAFANCIKHSGARTVEVETELLDRDGAPRARISIVDDGRGMAGPGRGRGLRNMERRARSLGGELRIDSRPGRTAVSLFIPVAAG